MRLCITYHCKNDLARMFEDPLFMVKSQSVLKSQL